jgi:hypothetical protein
MADDPHGLFEATRRKEEVTRFRRSRPPLRWVGLLSPLAGKAALPIRLDRDQVTLGRKDCDVVLADDSVSRQHARVRRDGDDFVLEGRARHRRGCRWSCPGGLRVGDRIVRYDGQAIHNLADWTRTRRDDRPGDPPRELRVLRGGQEQALQAPPGRWRRGVSNWW